MAGSVLAMTLPARSTNKACMPGRSPTPLRSMAVNSGAELNTNAHTAHYPVRAQRVAHGRVVGVGGLAAVERVPGRKA